MSILSKTLIHFSSSPFPHPDGHVERADFAATVMESKTEVATFMIKLRPRRGPLTVLAIKTENWLKKGNSNCWCSVPLAETVDDSTKAPLSGLIQVHHLQGVQANENGVEGKDDGTQLDVLFNEDDHADDHNGVHDDHHDENEKGQRHQRAQHLKLQKGEHRREKVGEQLQHLCGVFHWTAQKRENGVQVAESEVGQVQTENEEKGKQFSLSTTTTTVCPHLLLISRPEGRRIEKLHYPPTHDQVPEDGLLTGGHLGADQLQLKAVEEEKGVVHQPDQGHIEGAVQQAQGPGRADRSQLDAQVPVESGEPSKEWGADLVALWGGHVTKKSKAGKTFN
ncbi:hypothetical protein TYRP_011196 [Tyrophagus putrescentiae]|nr:hypothetical protein TYRP_011196 [Tyrophagus putrescentiae]